MNKRQIVNYPRYLSPLLRNELETSAIQPPLTGGKEFCGRNG